MGEDTGRRARLVREYIEQPTSEPPPPAQGDTGRFVVVPDGRVGYVPPQPCAQHSGIKVELRHLQEDIREVQTTQREQADKIRKLELLPWRVVAAAVGGGGGVAGVIELVRVLVAAAGG
jgi:hypothetical protein